MAGKLSELTNNLDVDDDADEFEHRDVSEAADTDAQNKAWTLGDFKGVLPFKQPVRVATTTNGTLATAYENADTVDGITLATGDRILLKDQTTGSENGIYTVNASGAPTRGLDFDTSAKVKGGMIIVVQEGTANTGKAFRITNTGTITIGTTALTFAEFGTLGSDIGAKITKSAVQSIANSTWTSLTWNEEVWDTDGMHDNVTNNERITIKTAGKYLCIFMTQWATSNAGDRYGRIRKNAEASTQQAATSLKNASAQSQETVSVIMDLAVDDFVDVRVFQNSGASLNFDDTVYNDAFFMVQKIDKAG